jgi:hypothetical protein
MRPLRLTEGILPALLIGHIRENRAAQLAFFQPDAKLSQVARERIHVRVIILSVSAQIVPGQLARRPGFIKGMTEQIILMNAFFQQREKCVRFHSHLGTLHYTGLGGRRTRRLSSKRCSAGRKLVPSMICGAEHPECPGFGDPMPQNQCRQ